MQHLIEGKLLPYVIRPGQYIGSEMGHIKKDHQDRLAIALGYPDKYEVGMSYLGQQILYNVINQDDRFACERFFSPDLDAEAVMREKNIPMFSLESFKPLKEFDLIGFTLAYEMTFTNILNILDLSGIALRSKDRTEDDPIIMAGGPVAHNPEPTAAFFDMYYIGDAEEQILKIFEIFKDSKGQSKFERLKKVVENIPSVYVPAFYDETEKTPLYDFVPRTVRSFRISGLKREYYSSHPLIPYIETVHDRLTVEIMRGCPRGCRFCQAGLIYKPVRCRKMSEIISQIDEQLGNSGYDEVSLLSLSSSDYPDIIPLTIRLSREMQEKRVALSLPSLRPGTFSQKLADAVKRTRKTGLTFAPEAGTERLRAVIRKDVTDTDLFDTLQLVFENGWNLVKLYYMIGLPTETMEDLDGLIDMVYEASRIARSKRGKNNIKVSISPFSPKPHTSFQWDQQPSRNEIAEKNDYLRRKIRSSNVKVSLRDPNLSFLEGIIGRGGRELADVIESAFKAGARFDGWTENFDIRLWEKAFEDNNIDPEIYLAGRAFSDRLPWSHIEIQQSVEGLIKERQRTSDLLKSEKKAPEKIEPRTNDGGNSTMFGRGKKQVIRQNPLAAPNKARVRIRWGCKGLVRFLSHLDNVRVFERAIRRANLEVEYSQGFHPHMKLSFGPPLQLGCSSEAEYFDIVFDKPFTPQMASSLNSQLPDGFFIIEARPNFTGKKVSISAKLNRAVYEVKFAYSEKIENAISEFIAKDKYEVERRGKSETKLVDIRPGVYIMKYNSEQDKLYLELGVGQAGYAKPIEVLKAVGIQEIMPIEELVIHRKEMLYIDESGNRMTPMDF